MNTKINITYKGEVFTLEYDRASIKLLEHAGFVSDEFLKKPMNNVELVFAGAFLKNHPNLPQTKIDDIYKSCKDKSGLVSHLNAMIQETYDALLEEPEGDEGNASWEVVDLTPKANQK